MLDRQCVVVALVCAACASASAAGPLAAPPNVRVVVIERMRFDPPDLVVRRGERVVWINKDLFAHTATAQSAAFDSQSIAPDASWSYVAKEPGRYPYRCMLHPTMRATLTVR
ncbi:cupredoxin family copper-binding protein [Caballeronia sp. Lep1P3]|uniref:cupredoxin domain-containing protein n=1 Tax=Caballeronia sp. Lep1P3 TaxID=2878150 RepID=UPI001FD1AA30|nr:cupredoxin family copper-binding protein [Caballeronia sp. Lep1P3]